jgi:hypothetical protein
MTRPYEPHNGYQSDWDTPRVNRVIAYVVLARSKRLNLIHGLTDRHPIAC